jgi:hypothetical protein
MANPIIHINNPESPVPELKNLLAAQNHVFFVILGNSEDSKQLANSAASYAVNWRFIVHAAATSAVLQALAGLPRASDIGTVPALANWRTLAISFDGTVVVINDTYALNDVISSFLLAETYKKEEL